MEKFKNVDFEIRDFSYHIKEKQSKKIIPEDIEVFNFYKSQLLAQYLEKKEAEIKDVVITDLWEIHETFNENPLHILDSLRRLRKVGLLNYICEDKGTLYISEFEEKEMFYMGQWGLNYLASGGDRFRKSKLVRVRYE